MQPCTSQYKLIKRVFEQSSPFIFGLTRTHDLRFWFQIFFWLFADNILMVWGANYMYSVISKYFFMSSWHWYTRIIYCKKISLLPFYKHHLWDWKRCDDFGSWYDKLHCFQSGIFELDVSIIVLAFLFLLKKLYFQVYVDSKLLFAKEKKIYFD
jgi:hypothetical protein